MEEAKKLAVKSPIVSRSITPIQLPDTTGSNIINIIQDFTPVQSTSPSPPTSLVTNGSKACPLISVFPPTSPNISCKTKDQAVDLINLQSENSSPVLPTKFQESLGKISDENSIDDEDKDNEIILNPSKLGNEGIIKKTDNLVEDNNFEALPDILNKEEEENKDKVIYHNACRLEKVFFYFQNMIRSQPNLDRVHKSDNKEEQPLPSTSSDGQFLKTETDQTQLQKSPLSARNIQRIGDRGKQRPKKSWI